MKRWYLGLLLMSGALVASAATLQEVRKSAEGSMLVTGSVTVNPDGTLNTYALDQPEKLPSAVVELIGKSVPLWQFKLSAPAAQPVSTAMSLRVVAKPTAEGGYRVLVAGASFGTYKVDASSISYKYHSSPSYPSFVSNANVSGTVYVLVRVGRDGAVQDAIAEEVDLDQYATEGRMDRFRQLLTEASLGAVRRWTFNTPTEGPEANNPYWVARIPIVFDVDPPGVVQKAQRYGSWHPYIPGPHQTASWNTQALASQAPNATPDGVLLAGNAGVTLITPLGGS